MPIKYIKDFFLVMGIGASARCEKIQSNKVVCEAYEALKISYFRK